MTTTEVRTVALPSGERVPVLGQGTWHMAEDPHCWTAEIAALRLGLELGLRLIDTAEMYADGAAEELVAEAIAGRRDEVFLVTKVLPQHATRRGTIVACEQSLRRLGTDRLDLYLLPIMAYSPLEQGRLARHTVLEAVAAGHAATPVQVALAWTLRRPGIIVIPKASTPDHVIENRAALDLPLTGEDLAWLELAFPPPNGPQPLEIL